MRKLFTILALFVVAAFTMAVTAEERANESVLTGDKVVECAKKYLGTRYRSGGMSPKRGFDCSGFTSFIYSNHDIVLPHSSRSQFATLKG
ncbi:MAG: NlpC/P60 family protein, partial [Bacteroidales bacterium]|nr:NlpC/P60 family protein [Bacteroidales bacterium]